MIDFRYHVVSIIAVFLALTVGLVLGATIVNQDAVNNLHGTINGQTNQINTLKQNNRSLTGSNGQLQNYIDTTKDNLVSGALEPYSVIVVRIDGSDDGLDKSTLSLIKQASATIASDITVNKTFADGSSTDQLAQLVSAYTPLGQPVTGTGTTAAMNLLAEALTAQQSLSTPPTSSGITSNAPSTMTPDWAVRTLQAFAQNGVITVNTMPSSAVVTRPNAAFIAAPTEASGAPANAAYIALAEALHADGTGAVIAGTAGAAGTGGLITAVLKSPAAKSVSTVDDVDQTTGQVAVVFVLYQEAANASAAAGHYGTVGTTDGLLPKLPTLPTPSAS
ncbi:MAG TPA: copper transporter [Actinocrinis sp.]|uniref:copper transporter n=1 Tax=Actinocrinis sp. TaxID=1920516 RepID=UPI002DDCCA68|nr:copper transporter [Actinocrinis sp.]HEV3172781.1 copper transporter [Actinocrinis sp.]